MTYTEQDEKDINELLERFHELDLFLEGMQDNISTDNTAEKIVNLGEISKKVASISERWMEIRYNGVLDAITIAETNLVLVLINMKIIQLAVLYEARLVRETNEEIEKFKNNKVPFNFSLN